MINARLKLQNRLETILGNRNVYFQPPENISMKYPCIRYSLDNIATNKASNSVYKKDYCYTLILIHTDPDNDVVDKILDMKYSRLNKVYNTQGLYHYVFTIYYKE